LALPHVIANIRRYFNNPAITLRSNICLLLRNERPGSSESS